MTTESEREIRILKQRLLMNLNRVIDFQKSLKNQNKDAFRLLIVFVHSVFEDMLRQLAVFRLESGLDVWDDELVLPELSDRKTKFSVGELAKQYSDLSLKELRQTAIRHQIEMTTFNNTSQVVSYLELLQFEIPNIENYLPELQQGIRRRHKIVHEADLDGEPPVPNPITAQDVSSFVGAAGGLLFDVLSIAEGRERSALDEPKFIASFGVELGLTSEERA